MFSGVSDCCLMSAGCLAVGRRASSVERRAYDTSTTSRSICKEGLPISERHACPVICWAMYNSLATAAALAALFCALLIGRTWDPAESLGSNLLVLPRLLEQSLDPASLVRGAPTPSAQRALLDRLLTRPLEQVAGSALLTRIQYGAEAAAASFGPGAARTAELTVPSRDGGGMGPGGTIPVTCACPADAAGLGGVDGGRALPLILYYHSGGLVMGSVEAELPLVRLLAVRSEAAVCSVGYRLAPEHPYPAGLGDAVDAAVALLSGGAAAAGLGVPVDPARSATFGYSAGGYLSAMVVRHLAHRAAGLDPPGGAAVPNVLAPVPVPLLQISQIPMARPAGGAARGSAAERWDAPIWSGPANAYAWGAYLRDDGDADADAGYGAPWNWTVSLLTDLPEPAAALLPPAYVQIHTKDVLRDEGERYADRLAGQGRLLRLDEYATHHAGGLPGLMSRGGPGEPAFDAAVGELNRVLHGPP